MLAFPRRRVGASTGPGAERRKGHGHACLQHRTHQRFNGARRRAPGGTHAPSSRTTSSVIASTGPGAERREGRPRASHAPRSDARCFNGARRRAPGGTAGAECGRDGAGQGFNGARRRAPGGTVAVVIGRALRRLLQRGPAQSAGRDVPILYPRPASATSLQRGPAQSAGRDRRLVDWGGVVVVASTGPGAERREGPRGPCAPRVSGRRLQRGPAQSAGRDTWLRFHSLAAASVLQRGPAQSAGRDRDDLRDRRGDVRRASTGPGAERREGLTATC